MKARRLLIGGVAAGLTATALFLGGALHGSPQASSAPVARPPAADRHVDADSRNSRTSCAGAATTCARSTRSGSRTSSGPARRATRPTTPSRTRCCAGRSARAARPARDQRPRLARALAPPLPRGARARPPRAGDLADDGAQLRRDRRRARRARPLPRGFRAFDTMAALQPGLSAYARVSHARQLLGDVPGAIGAMRLALERLARPGESRGVDARAARQARLLGRPLRAGARASAPRSAAFPGYAYGLDALARSRRRAATSTRRSRPSSRRSNRIPLPQYVATLGDLYARRPASARRAGSTR